MRQVECVVLDWAGTVVDYGSLAPTTIFVKALKEAYNFDITLEEARIPMGLGKWDHINALGKLPTVAARWKAQFNAPMSEQDVDYIYNTFIPLQKIKVVDHAEPIAGALAAINWLRQQNIIIGSCSGYPREVMDALVPVAAQYGYAPDCVVASDDLPAGSRPGPWMALENVNQLGVSAVWRVIKIDDAVPGILEGLNAGMWTIGLAKTGNAVGLTEVEWQQCSAVEKEHLLRKAYGELYNAGAHYVVDALEDIAAVVNVISARIARGERP